ncbi:MAG: DEAD/DEAH box helicase [Dissulfurispiraceae bacterium]
MLTLKDYQQRTLEALKAYFVSCSQTGNANTAFYSTTLALLDVGIPYNPVSALPGLPYVCLRIPTGGGKTLVACHSIGIASKHLLHAENTVALWLVPSNAIREQTLNALKEPRHPYRLALEAALGPVNVLDVEEALYVTRSSLDSASTVIVCTIQLFRVEDTVHRKVYENSGNLMPHFDDLPPEIEATLEKGEGGNVLYSLANVLRIRRPIVIVDEAHNARTDLSFETLTRFAPSCIIEFTATPAREKNPSNVLYSVSAAELKAEEMVKLPISLETRRDWKELLSDAILCRKNLESIAALERQETGEFIRPIVLLQAQPQRKDRETITVDVLLETLTKEHEIPREQIAVATGTKNELDDIEDIYSPKCPIRYVITIQALREGWDCHFAYVLCSVADMHSSTAVEQILGRILRLPKAFLKKRDELNMAYAFVASPHFAIAANSLTDALVQNGFERQEAKDLIVQRLPVQPSIPFEVPLSAPLKVELPELPENMELPETLSGKVTLDLAGKQLIFRKPITESERDELKKCFITHAAKVAIDTAYKRTRKIQVNCNGYPSERGVDFSIPVLALKQMGMFEPFEETHFLDHPWSLSKCHAMLSEQDYTYDRQGAEHGKIDVTENGKVTATFVSALQLHTSYFMTDSDWKLSDLVRWHDKTIPHKDISPQETGAFLTKLLMNLTEERGIALQQLVHDKIRLREAVTKKIDFYRQNAKKTAYQMLLDPSCKTPLVVTPDLCFSFKPHQYPYSTPYRGRYKFKKHYYPEIGDLKPQGEEFECAQYIDGLDEVDFWVRNLERRPQHSFWLQTSTDRFYPDFVCKLKDGRFLVVEYKGEHLLNEDSKEKKALGELWESRSTGKCLFVMPTGKDYALIKQRL